MSGVPYTFANATTTIALSNLDANFATPVTIGNTTVGLGNTVTTIGNLTLSNPTINNPTLNTNLTFASGTNGIVFNNNSSGELTASTLNDYETGTWTPGITPTSGAITSYTSSGTYTKIGRNVFITGTVTLTNVGSASGILQSTVPFTPLNISQNELGMSRESSQTGYFWYAFVYSGGVQIRSQTNGGITWTNNYEYDFSITYIATF